MFVRVKGREIVKLFMIFLCVIYFYFLENQKFPSFKVILDADIGSCTKRLVQFL
jgi:hypothetical protein